MAIQIQGNSGVVAEVEAGTRAMRVVARALDYGSLGYYTIAVMTGVYTGLGAASALFSARWGDATRFAVLKRAQMFLNTITASTAAGMIDRSIVAVRPFTVSDSGGTAINLTGNNNKMRSSMGASLMTDMRIASTGALTKGTGTEDAQAIGLFGKQGLAAEPIGLTIDLKDMLDDQSGDDHPLVLAQNEGWRGLIPTAMPTTIAQRTAWKMKWGEFASY